MDLPKYFGDVTEELERKSVALRRDYATHHGAAGNNRESLLKEFLERYLPKAFGIDTGLITSSDGRFSNQADLVIIDQNWNAPLYQPCPNPIWLVEAVYALIEVKTSLPPIEIADGVKKCRKFKQLPRRFCEAPLGRLTTESLFVLWSFESPASDVLKRNLVEALRDVPVSEQPDFVVVPGRLVAICGKYRELSGLGEPGSLYRQELEGQFGSDLASLPFDRFPVYEFGKDSLLVWLIWLLSWLQRAGPRSSELLAYLPPEKNWGRLL